MARRPEEASREKKNPAAASIERFFSLKGPMYVCICKDSAAPAHARTRVNPAKIFGFWAGETAVGSCGNALTRDHVLLWPLGARQQKNGQADEAVTLGHSAISWGVGNS